MAKSPYLAAFSVLLLLCVAPSSLVGQHVLAEETGVIDPAVARCGVCHGSHVGRGGIAGSAYNLQVDGDFVFGREAGNRARAPGPISQSCLRCHSTSERRENQREVLEAGPASRGRGYLGRDLTDDHPIGIVEPYDQSANAAVISDPSVQVSDAALSLIPQASGDKTWVIECNTCHDPHERNIALREMDDQNALCMDCHDPSRFGVSSHATLSCSTCHGLHGGERGLVLLRSRTVDGLCTACHGGSLDPIDERMDGQANSGLLGHLTPVDGLCSDCHRVH